MKNLLPFSPRPSSLRPPSTPSPPIKIPPMKKELTEEQLFYRLSALCARAEHCRQEMAAKMRTWQVPDDVQQRVIGRLADERYIDDSRYARAFVHDKVRYAKWGRRKIEQALYMKRIPDDAIAAALDEVDPSEYIETLRPMLQAKAKSIKADNPYELEMKLMRFAAGRGFSVEEAKAAMR